VYAIKKFPNAEKDDWIIANKGLIQEELTKYEGLYEEPLKSAFQEVIADYIYLQNIMDDVTEWKGNFLRFIAHTMNMAEGELRQRNAKRDFHEGRLSLIKEILEWF
jgi:hypothetical protein